MSGKLVNKKIRESIESNFKTHPKRLVLGVSGGPDSQCLLKALPHALPDCKILAVGVHHGFREEADSELDLAEKLAHQVGVSFIRVHTKITREPRQSLQAIARDARYKILFDEADRFQSDFVVTAHHAEDKAETFLIRLLRNHGLGSLDILPPISGRIYRPMLNIFKNEILEYLKFWKVDYAIDPSNENTDFLRVWIRKELMPQLASKNPKIQRRLVEVVDELHDVLNENQDPESVKTNEADRA